MAYKTFLVPLLALGIWYYQHGTSNTTPRLPDLNFNVEKVLAQSTKLATHSWEHGTTAQALLEFLNPELTVFGPDPFPGGLLPVLAGEESWKPREGLGYCMDLIWTNGSDLLLGSEGSPSDPASLGIPALLLGRLGHRNHDAAYTSAAQRQAIYLLQQATRFPINYTHSAISHRDSPPQLWGDFVYMVPPFLAYYGAATQELIFLKEAVLQCKLYDEFLRTDILVASGEQCHGLWRHIVSQPAELEPDTCCTDPHVWLTSNAWALAGMTRVLATIAKWNPPSGSHINEGVYMQFQMRSRRSLLTIITAMLDCLESTSRDPATGLLRNYLDSSDTSHATHGWSFGDAAGTALVTSAIYRLAVLEPELFAKRQHLEFADELFDAVSQRVDERGRVSPVADVESVPSKYPAMAGVTSEGQSMVVLMYAAWRDCILEGVCDGYHDWWEWSSIVVKLGW